MKYVIVKTANFETAIIFDTIIQHCDVTDQKVISAGFCAFSFDETLEGPYCSVGDWSVSVYGESISLGVKSRKKDADIIKKALNTSH